jgi:hypothetical protein
MAKLPKAVIDFCNQKFPAGSIFSEVRQASANQVAKDAKRHVPFEFQEDFSGSTVLQVVGKAFSQDVIDFVNNDWRGKNRKANQGASQEDLEFAFRRMGEVSFEENANGIFLIKRKFDAPTPTFTEATISALEAKRNELDAQIALLKAKVENK